MVWTAVMFWTAVLTGCVMTGANAQRDGNVRWYDFQAKSTSTAPLSIDNISEDVYCECVAYYLCVNGTISTSGAGVIDVRMGGGGTKPAAPVTNVEKCPDYLEVCCGLPPPEEDPTTTTTDPPLPTLPPDTPCECVPFINCTADNLVSDGRGDTTLDILGLGGYSHSQCPQAFAVCCALGPTPEPTNPEPLEDCECVARTMCDENGYIITDGEGLIDIRAGVDPSSENVCPQPFICCRPPSDDTSTTSTITTTEPLEYCECVTTSTCDENGYIKTDGEGLIDIRTTVQPSSDNVCPQPFICCRPPPDDTSTQPPTTQAPVQNCGTRNAMGVTARIFGFNDGESQFGEFPWVTAILNAESIMGKTFRRFVGGGSLIHPRVVLTAAHKVLGQNSNNLVARLGEWDTSGQLEPLPYQEIEVEEIIIHEHYNPSLLYHDVALLILKEEVMIQSHVNTICMAPDLQSVDSSACIINGWGLDGFIKGAQYQKIMKSLTLPLVRNRQCEGNLRTTRLGRYFRLHNSFLCAGGEEGKDACRGDGGGPLACPRKADPSRYLLVGITAWGIGCGEDGIPGVYVNVPAHQDWIRAQIEARIPKTTTAVTTTTMNATVDHSPLQSGDDDGEATGGEGGGVRGSRQEEKERRRQEREKRRQQARDMRRQEGEVTTEEAQAGREEKWEEKRKRQEERRKRQEQRKERKRQRQERKRERQERRRERE